MSEVRSLLVEAAEQWWDEELRARRLSAGASFVVDKDTIVRGLCAAVLDAMSEGPLHEQMVAAPPLLSVCTCNGEEHAIGCPVVSSHNETIWRQTVERILSAALGAARMEEE